VVLTCNPNYLGGGDQEDEGSRPARAKHLRNPISTNKKLGMVVSLSFQLQGKYK
jgi:hypothetical protein